MERKKTAPNGLRKIIRRGELYGLLGAALLAAGYIYISQLVMRRRE